jgi:hypothetical protein
MKKQSKGKPFSRKNQIGKGPTTRSQSKSIKSSTTLRSKSSSKPKSIRSLRRELKSTKSMRSPSKKSVRSRSNRTPSRHIQFNTPENQLLEYSLGSTEREWKQGSIDKSIPKCKKPKSVKDFPCRQKNTIFKTLKSYNKWQDLKSERNISTDYKSRREHYDDIDSILLTRGDEALLRK